ncbi:MAG: trypsin-like peptidase domain-containing protein [Tabrizicola sp.]|jgi:V8-like Glu-specific endopeptidase|nr:trypsin-like peptidase domain-containing protein [Tabrizicola sp.]
MRYLFPGLLALGIAVSGLWPTATAEAQDAGMVRLETADDSRGWDAVGKLVMGNRGFCTGALIGPQLVLTAAHCLYDKTTGVQVRPEDIEFQAGFRNGRAVAYRRVSRAVAHPDYRYAAEDKLDRVTDDLALLELSQPIRLPSLAPFETGDSPVQGDAVDVVSYAQYREEAPSIQEACEVLAGRRDTLILTCNVDFGSSGAPVFALQDGVVRVVSVISAKAEVDGRKVALAVPLAEPLAALRNALEDSRAGSSQGGKSVSVLSGGNGSGAKFIKP